jgi:flagellar basal-body rod protein FlgF
MDLVANNLANMDTPGFKVEEMVFNTYPGGAAKNEGIRTPALFVIDGGIGRDFGEGSLEQTGRNLDVAIDGNAFFQVSTPQGQRYTKNGRFGIDASGRLVTAQGYPVLDQSGGEITLDPKNGEPAIGTDGTISQRSAQGPTTVTVGKIGMVHFDQLGVLSKEGSGLYSNQSNLQPTPADPSIHMHQGMIESSNVKPLTEVTNLIQVQRAYERVTQMISQTNDLSQSSIDRLAKVS